MLTGFALPVYCQSDDPVVAEVNGIPIHRSSVREVVKGVLASSPELPSSSEIDALTREALDSLVDLELLYQEAVRRGILVSDEEVEQSIEVTRERFADEEEFEEALQRSGLTEAALQSETRKTLLVNRLLETVVWRGIEIPDSAVQRFFEENRAALAGPSRPRVRHILVRLSPGAPPADRENALVKVKSLRRQLVAGADFAQLARDNSEDEATAARGGDLGYLQENPADPLARAAQSLQPGEISPVIETADGYHILEVTQRSDPAPQQPDPAMRASITQVLEEEARQRRQAEFVAALRKGAKINFVAPTPVAEIVVVGPTTTPPAEGRKEAPR